MRPELLVALAVFFSYMGASTASPMFSQDNCPKFFSGSGGQGLFMAVNSVIVLGSLSLLVWSFLHVSWYINVLILLGAMALTQSILRVLPTKFVRSAAAPVCAAVALCVLHRAAWFSS